MTKADMKQEFEEYMEGKGFEVMDVMFSVSHSQGDGAAFTGSVVDMEKFFHDAGLKEDFPQMYHLSQLGGVGVSVRTFGRYSHSGTMQLVLDVNSYFDFMDWDASELQIKVAYKLELQINNEIIPFEGACLSYFRDKAYKLYKRLLDNYDYLTSDKL